jgi:F-type H+-transporting ATPase subunit b
MTLRSMRSLNRFLIGATLCSGISLATQVALAQDIYEIAAKKEAKSEAAEPDAMWKWINFGLLAVGLGYLLGKTLPPFFKSRTSDIQKDIVEAQATKRDAEQRAAAIEKRVSALGADIEAFQAQSRTEMEQEAARIREETARMIEKVQKQAGNEIETAGKNAQRDLKAYAAKLSLDMAEQRIRTRLDTATENGLVDDFVKDLQAEGSKN